MYLLDPPAHGYPDDGEERPPFVLIEPYAYFAVRENATTVACRMRGFKGEFKVTFCTARPPLVSYMCFEATAYAHTAFAIEPQILATETDGARVLLRVVFGEHPSAVMFPHNREYLVYDASVPSLEHLPHPNRILFSDDSIAFLRKCTHDGASHDCSDCRGYVLSAHSGGLRYGVPSQLYLYHSDSGTWEEKQLVLKQPSYPARYHSTCKAITIGGDKGTVAWVDLWHNIIICDDVFAEHPQLRTLQLPSQILLDNELQRGNPRSVRDIALLDGLFKYVEMQFHHLVQPGSPGHWEWEVTVWSTKTSSSSAMDWIAEYKLKSSEITEPSPPMLQARPGEIQPTLSALHIGLPNLSLQDAGIVYFLSKVYHCNNDHVAWVLAVDMRNKSIQKVSEFSPSRTLGLAKGYDATTISNFLKGTKQNQKRPGTALMKCPSKKSSSMTNAGTSMVI